MHELLYFISHLYIYIYIYIYIIHININVENLPGHFSIF